MFDFEVVTRAAQITVRLTVTALLSAEELAELLKEEADRKE